MNDIFIPDFNIQDKGGLSLLSNQIIPWSLYDLKIPELWKETEGEGVTILILDTGIEDDHEDLKENVKNELNKSFVKTEPSTRDFNGHGTASAGVAACRNNDRGVVGVAPKANIISYKVMGKYGSGSVLNFEKALEYAWDRRDDIDIVNVSLGSKSPLSIKTHRLIKNLTDYGIPVVCAAGNVRKDGVLYPAKYPETFAIGAYGFGAKRDIAEFSAMGNEVDFCAPGCEIRTSWIGNTYATVSGTSFACPFFSGMLALLLSKLKKENKKLSVSQIKKMLIKASLDYGVMGKDTLFGFGVVCPHKLIFAETPEGEIEFRKKNLWDKCKGLFGSK